MPDSAPSPQQVLIDALARGELVGDLRRQAEVLLEHNDALRERFRHLTRGKFPAITNYTIIEQIGKGGFGVVYKAVHHATERIVALKLLFSKTPIVATYFENEVHLIARLRHPNIATLYDAQLTAPPLYYTMDYVQGERLNDYIRKNELSLADRIQLLSKVVLAIGYAHSQGVVHRDVKPQNILIDDKREPHIVDFGIAKKLRLEQIPDAYRAPVAARRSLGRIQDEETPLTPEGPVGTLGYIAPEVANGTGMDARSDIFALGALLFHCVTLEPARIARDPAQREELLAARRVSHLEDLSAIIGRCVATDPRARYASCVELAADLECYLRGRPITARSDESFARRAARTASLIIREYPVALRLTLAMACAAILTLVFWSLRTRTGSQPLSPGQTVIVSFTDQTIEKIDSGGYDEIAPGIIPHAIHTYRGLHGRLMERLALANPLVVVWDYYFDEPAADQKFDEAFARGAARLMERQIPVVVGAAEFDENSEPRLCGPIRDAVHSFGTLASPDMENIIRGEFEIAAAFRRGFEDPVPGLAVAAFAAYRHFDRLPSLEIDGERFELRLRYRLRTSPRSGEKRTATEIDRIPLYAVHEVAAPPASLPPGKPRPFAVKDIVAHQRIFAEPPEAWHTRTISYDAVMAADEKQIQRWFDRKAVLIGQMRPGIDEHTIWGDTRIFGCIVHAQALDSLLLSFWQQRVFPHGIGPYAVLWCAAAALLASVTRPRRWQGMRWVTIICAVLTLLGLIVAISAALVFRELWMLQLAIAMSALLCCGAPAYWAKAYREWQMQLAPASISYTGEMEQLPSTILASGSR